MTQPSYDGQAETIAMWLLDRISIEAEVARDRISVTDDFDQLPIDSIVLVTLADQLEKWSGHQINPTVFWEFENTERLSQWLASQ
jgi:acyl carrier protein